MPIVLLNMSMVVHDFIKALYNKEKKIGVKQYWNVIANSKAHAVRDFCKKIFLCQKKYCAIVKKLVFFVSTSHFSTIVFSCKQVSLYFCYFIIYSKHCQTVSKIKISDWHVFSNKKLSSIVWYFSPAHKLGYNRPRQKNIENPSPSCFDLWQWKKIVKIIIYFNGFLGPFATKNHE